MKVTTKFEDLCGSVILYHDDYDKISKLFNDIRFIQEKSNDPLLDAIQDEVPDGFVIDEDSSSWEIVNEKESSVELSFKIKHQIIELKMDEKIHLSLNDLKSLFLEGKQRAIEEQEVETNDREEGHYDALDFGDYLFSVLQVTIIE